MTWTNTLNVTKTAQGSYRSIAGYASESLVVGRALLCGYIIFVKAWRDSKYDAVLDANGTLYRIEIKGTSGESTISTSSGGRAGAQISREAESRERALSTQDCDWLIATTSMDSQCWIIPIEFIEILDVKTIPIPKINQFKEKWSIFVNTDSNIQPYLKTGYRTLSYQNLVVIATSLGIDYENLTSTYSYDGQHGEPGRGKKTISDTKDRLIIEIWDRIFRRLDV